MFRGIMCAVTVLLFSACASEQADSDDTVAPVGNVSEVSESSIPMPAFLGQRN